MGDAGYHGNGGDKGEITGIVVIRVWYCEYVIQKTRPNTAREEFSSHWGVKKHERNKHLTSYCLQVDCSALIIVVCFLFRKVSGVLSS